MATIDERNVKLKYDPEANAIYIRLSDKAAVKTRPARKNLSNAALDYASDGTIVGVELLGVSSGIDLTGLPKGEILSALLLTEGFHLKHIQQNQVNIIENPRALRRKEFLEALFQPTGVALGDLSNGARGALENYVRFVLDSGDAPSASWNNPLLEICRAVESEIEATLAHLNHFAPLAKLTLGQKAHWLRERKDDPAIKSAITGSGMSPDFFVDKLPKALLRLASIRAITGAAHGQALMQNATKRDAEKAISIAVTGAHALIPILVNQRKVGRSLTKQGL